MAPNMGTESEGGFFSKRSTIFKVRFMLPVCVQT